MLIPGGEYYYSTIYGFNIGYIVGYYMSLVDISAEELEALLSSGLWEVLMVQYRQV